jgi:hypothetical protein
MQEISGAPLTPVTVLHESAARLRRPHIAIDTSQVVHLLWQERFAKGAGARVPQGTWVHYARLTSRAQSQPTLLRQEVLNQRPMALHPDLAVDARGVAYSVWEEGGGAVVLTRIAGQSQPVEHRRITALFGKDRHGYPAVAVDQRGTLHVTWTASGNANRTQIIYATLPVSNWGTQQAVSQQPIYATAPVFGQPKRISVDDRTGQVTITWRNQRTQGQLGRMAASDNSITLKLAGSSTARKLSRVLDTHLTPSPEGASFTVPVAVLGKPLMVAPPPGGTTRVTLPVDSLNSAFHRFDGTVEKLQLAKLLAYSSWTGAPPNFWLQPIPSGLFSRDLGSPPQFSLVLYAKRSPYNQPVCADCIDAYGPAISTELHRSSVWS